jgi:histone H3/H4
MGGGGSQALSVSSPARSVQTSQTKSPRKVKSICHERHKPLFRRYIAKILQEKQTKISGHGMSLLNKLVESIADDIWKTAILITQKSNRKTVGTKDANTAVKILFTQNLFESVSPYANEHLDSYVEDTPSDADGSIKGSKHVSRSSRALLTFPVGRVERIAREKHLRRNQRISNSCAVYISAVLEFVTNAIVYESEQILNVKGQKVLTPRHFLFGVSNNPDLKCLVQNYNIINAGIVPTPQLSASASTKAKKAKLQLGGDNEPLRPTSPRMSPKFDDSEDSDDPDDIAQEGGYEDIREDITKPGVVRLMRRAGVLRVGGETYETTLSIIDDTLSVLLKATTALSKHKNLKTVRVTEVEDAIEILNLVRHSEVFKPNMQGQCMSDMSANSSVRNRSPKSKSAGDDESEMVEANKRKAKPGVKVKRDIKMYQNTTDLLLQRTGFARAVRITEQTLNRHESSFDTRYGATALRLLQSIVENYLVGIFQEANKAADHANRKTLQVKDLVLAQFASGMCS